MNLSQTVTDNVTELLNKIVDFTDQRRGVLTKNILNCNARGFVPQDLDTEEFATVMSCAVAEYIKSKRLLFCDAENIRFGRGGSFNSFTVVDEEAKSLFEKDINEYLELQTEKLSENLLNSKIAKQLLEQRQSKASSVTLF